MVQALKRPAARPFSGWSGWRLMPLRPPPEERVLAEILDGGQSFRWHRLSDGTWRGVWSSHVVRLRLAPGKGVEWSAPSAMAAQAGPALARYLDADADASEAADPLPWRSDAHLAECIRAFPGLRILRQPLDEALMCFICSAAKRIVQIKQIAALLADRHGTPVEGAVPAINRLPTWAELARLTEANLLACKLGFRAKNLLATAKVLAERPGWLAAAAALPYPEARDRLTQLPGVGGKIADCALLYGAGRMEAFPSDVWILKAMADRYGLQGWKPPAVALFGRTHFGPLAGLAQQYLFAYERSRS